MPPNASQHVALPNFVGCRESYQQRVWCDQVQRNSAVLLAEQGLSTAGLLMSGRADGCKETIAAPAGGRKGIEQREQQEFLWQDFFFDPAQWWDNRQDKRSSRHPDFRHKRLRKALWLDNVYKPAWVDLQLAQWDAQLADEVAGPSGSTPTPTSRRSTGPRTVVRGEGELDNETSRGECEDEQLTDAVENLELMVQRGSRVDSSLLYRLLKRCIAQKDLGLGRQVHALSLKGGYQSNPFLANHFVRMYASHGKLQEAMQVFREVTAPDSFMWCSIISAHAEHGQPSQAINLYRQMRESTVKLNGYVFLAVLKACATAMDLNSGKEVHTDILESGIQPDLFVGSCLVDMYAKCGSLEDARKVFDTLQTKNVVVWTAMMAGYAQHGLWQEMFALYASMQREAISLANSVTFVCLLKACGSARDLVKGRQIHSHIQDKGMENAVVVANALVDMYAKCGSLGDARAVFDRVPTRDVVTWTAMIAGYAHHGLGQEALELYSGMLLDGMTPANHVTFVCLLQACASFGALHQGKQLHAQILERDLENDAMVGNCLVDMYAKCGSLEDARNMFDRLPTRDVVTWTSLIAGYARQDLGCEALALYSSMQKEGKAPADRITFVCLLQACANVGALHQGEQLHAQIQQRGLEADVAIANCLVNMYTKCKSLVNARRVFDTLPQRDIVTWNAMIAGYAQNGLGQEALVLYAAMQKDSTIVADHITFVSLLQACSGVGALQEGKELHAQIQERGLESHLSVANSLVDLYNKCGRIVDSRRVFDSLHKKDMVTWTAMIAGYAQHGLGREALLLYVQMENEGITPSEQTFACLLKACASVGAFCEGKYLHAQIQERGMEANQVVGNGLVDMYAKFGRLDDACDVFQRLPARDVVTWNALLNGYAEHGHGQMAIQCFDEMQLHDVEPNDVTFSCLLVACSHEGLVKEGQMYFKMMAHHSIVPTVYHYTCMVDLLGRSGRLDEAEDVLRTMPFTDDVVGWTSLLSACKAHTDLERGQRCFNNLVKLDPENATPYVLLASIYATAGRWRDVEMMESLRKSAGAKKKPAKACIEVRNKMHEFTVGEDTANTSPKLRNVHSRLKEDGGHMPHTDLVLRRVSEIEKEDALCGHAEKLALAYGLVNTPDGTTLLVTKNLRMCNDCHSSTKIMSRIEKREIVVRDAHRVHRFVDGCCSCRDRE